MSSDLLNKLQKLEKNASKAGSGSATAVLEWTRFVSPLAVFFEQLAPQYDYQEVKANGYRSLLSILEHCVDELFGGCSPEQLKTVGDLKLRAYAQGCEMMLYGAFIYSFTRKFAKDESQDPKEQSLFPQMDLVKHACYQQMAAKCNADIDVRDFQLAGVSFGFSFPLRTVMRVIQSAIVGWDESRTEWEAARASFSRIFDSKVGKEEDADVSDASDEERCVEAADNEYLRHKETATIESLSLVRKAAEIVYWPFVFLKGLAKIGAYSLPVGAIERMRADKAKDIEQRNDVSIIQACWNQTETAVVHASEMLVAPSIGHVELVRLHFDGFAVQVRIVCPHVRSRHPTSCTRLIVHAHGGGFIAHTSKSHEGYLRRIANELQSPIVSIDYSTAPQRMYPTAVDECFAVYKWLQQSLQGRQDIENSAIFSALRRCSSCENICFLGDSAGGNLMLCVLQRCILENVQLPKGYVGLYAPLLLQFAPSPSRMVPYADAFIPNRTLAMCLVGYFGYNLQDVLDEIERDCPFHNQEQPSGSIHVDGLNLCPDCAHLQVANSGETAEWLTKLNKLRAPLFKKIDYGGTSKEWRTACAMAKLQSWTEFVNYPNDDARRRLTPEVLKSPPDLSKPSSAPLRWPSSVLAKLPKISLITPAVMDATVDDSVEFAKRCATVGTRVKLEIVHNVSHGFLNFAAFCPNSMKGLQVCIRHLKETFEEA